MKKIVVGVFFDTETERVKLSKEDVLRIKKRLAPYIIEKKFPAEINVVTVSPQRIKKINADFRGVKEVTDVLSFNLTEDRIHFSGWQSIGEIYLCPSYIKKGRKKGENFRYLLEKTLLHGLLHLAGYDHVLKGEARKMEKIEREILKDFRI